MMINAGGRDLQDVVREELVYDPLSHENTRRLDNQLHLANDQILRKMYTRYTCFYSRPSRCSVSSA
jgi:hypothetical protein